MALAHKGDTFFHVIAVLLGIGLVVCLGLFLYLALRRTKSVAEKLRFLISAAVRKRREMATYGVKPNPPYFRSQLRSKQEATIKAEVFQKRRARYMVVLGYAFQLYDPVICLFHRRCRRSRPRSPRYKDALASQAKSTELMDAGLLRPGRWFLLLQYMAGLFILWFVSCFWLAVFYITQPFASNAVGVFIGVALFSALFAAAATIAFYWYSYRLYVGYVKTTFQKSFLTMLAEPLSKPRPTRGGPNQSMNLYAVGHSPEYSRAIKSLDAGFLRRKYES